MVNSFDSAIATRPSHSAHIIASDAEALRVAREVAAQLAPEAAARDRERRKPVAELDLLSSRGLLALTVPREHGGADVSAETLAQVFQILAAADSAVAQLPQSHFVFVNALREDGDHEQKRFFFAEILAGARLGNAQAERGAASPLDLKTRLRRAGADYVLDGTKHYTTGALFAHWLPVAAIDELGRLALAYVPRDAAGVELLDDWNALGQRATHSGTARFAAVHVPAAHVVAHWRLFERPSTFHAFAQLLHAAIDVGIAQNALADTAAAVRTRKRPRLGSPVANPTQDPLLLLRFGQLATKLHAAEALLLRAARAIDQAGPRPGVDFAASSATAAVLVGEAKAYAEDVSVEIASELFALLGTSASDESLDLDRHWRNARVHSVHDANQWRYHAAGNWFINGIAPAKPVRRLAVGDSPSA